MTAVKEDQLPDPRTFLMSLEERIHGADDTEDGSVQTTAESESISQQLSEGVYEMDNILRVILKPLDSATATEAIASQETQIANVDRDVTHHTNQSCQREKTIANPVSTVSKEGHADGDMTTNGQTRGNTDKH